MISEDITTTLKSLLLPNLLVILQDFINISCILKQNKLLNSRSLMKVCFLLAILTCTILNNSSIQAFDIHN